MKVIRVATRSSKLAVVQANTVAEALMSLDPGIKCELVMLKTAADINHSAPIASIGGKGVFIKELEQALLANKADIAVHSVKDMPSKLQDKFVLPAILPRVNAHDVLISDSDFGSLPEGAVVGTSSLRRTSQLRLLRPDLTYKDIRGNIDTRINKLNNGYDAIILAAAGVLRLGYEEHIRHHFSIEEIMPAAGQGAIGVECLSENDSIINLISKLNYIPSAAAVAAERSCMWHLGGHCMAPIAAYASLSGDNITLRMVVTNKDSSEVLRASRTATDATELGKDVAKELIAKGALNLINTAV